MRIRNIIASAITLGVISTGAMAAKGDNYIGIKYAALSTDKVVYGDGETSTSPYMAYKDVDLIGLEFQKLKNLDSVPIMLGMGVDLMLYEGNFFDGGVFDVDFKLGSYYRDLRVYGLVGVGVQSLSEHTLAAGFVYGAGINYDILEHLSAKVEYRVYDLQTSGDDYSLPDQDYTLSGLNIGVSYKF